MELFKLWRFLQMSLYRFDIAASLCIFWLLSAFLNEKSNVLLLIALIAQFSSALPCFVTDVAIHKNTWIDDFTTVYVMFVFGVTIEYYSICPAVWLIILSGGDSLLVGAAIIIILSTFFRHVINAITIIKMSKIVNKADTADTYDLYNGDSDDIQNIND